MSEKQNISQEGWELCDVESKNSLLQRNTKEHSSNLFENQLHAEKPAEDDEFYAFDHLEIQKIYHSQIRSNQNTTKFASSNAKRECKSSIPRSKSSLRCSRIEKSSSFTPQFESARPSTYHQRSSSHNLIRRVVLSRSHVRHSPVKTYSDHVECWKKLPFVCSSQSPWFSGAAIYRSSPVDPNPTVHRKTHFLFKSPSSASYPCKKTETVREKIIKNRRKAPLHKEPECEIPTLKRRDELIWKTRAKMNISHALLNPAEIV
eukprot:MONOS_487.1-p1 / transcript=MONOS_487.1 / gene=MONOS_487 / organism=Monocercomonoides_exilis_PA203 / gene_product=unspecified product / transcript_product=unspecified product / location=Mono_scaffold00007:287504-288392(+) / protein_length=261 / sequence_SO=supercontig / SO=protein_coding / is_pseudo=false